MDPDEAVILLGSVKRLLEDIQRASSKENLDRFSEEAKQKYPSHSDLRQAWQLGCCIGTLQGISDATEWANKYLDELRAELQPEEDGPID